METHPNSPFFLAFFGPSRATVVYRFWKGDCYMRIWESHHVLILTTFGTMNYPIIWQHEGGPWWIIIFHNLGIIICSFFPTVSTWKCDMRSLWVHYQKIWGTYRAGLSILRWSLYVMRSKIGQNWYAWLKNQRFRIQNALESREDLDIRTCFISRVRLKFGQTPKGCMIGMLHRSKSLVNWYILLPQIWTAAIYLGAMLTFTNPNSCKYTLCVGDCLLPPLRRKIHHMDGFCCPKKPSWEWTFRILQPQKQLCDTRKYV